MNIQQGKKGFIGKLLLFFLISMLSLVIILGTAAAILITRTPRELGLQDVAIGSKTVEEMGLADTRFIDILRSFKNIISFDESTIVTNGYDSETEKTASSQSFEHSSLSGTDNYSAVLTGHVVYDNQYLITYNDTTLGYIINNAVQYTTSGDTSVEFMQNAKISLVEMTVTKGESNGTLRSVCKMDVSDFTQQIKNNLGVVASILSVPENLYLVSEVDFTVDGTGKLQTTHKSIAVNGNEADPIVNSIIDLVIGNLSGVNSLEDINIKMGEAFSEILYNLGGVGTADVDSNNIVVANINYGLAGVTNGKMSFITHTA